MAFFDWLRGRFGGRQEGSQPPSQLRSSQSGIEEVAALVEREGLKEHWRDLQRLLRPAVFLELEACDPRTITAEHSFLGGGVAFLRRGEEWPSVDGRALDPLARVRLSEASAQDPSGVLPRNGVVTFWYSVEEQPWGLYPEDAGFVRVTYTPEDAAVERREQPGAAKRPPLRRVRFVPGFTLPDREELPEGLEFGNGDEYFELLHAMRPADEHQMLGYADLVQGSMLEHEPQARTAPKDDWLLLLQVDSDDALDWMWGDSGKLYFWINRHDLAKCDFSKVWLRLQCY